MWRELGEVVATAALISWLLITFVVQAFYIPSGSMEPTLQPGDRIFVNKFIYRFREPERQEIIVFRYPVHPQQKFVKRIIGLPGDKVKISNGQVYVNGDLLAEPYLKEHSYSDYPLTEIPAGHYFVLGDNRNNSQDSRFWGFVPRENILGKPFVIFWPFSRMKWVGGRTGGNSVVSPSHG